MLLEGGSTEVEVVFGFERRRLFRRSEALSRARGFEERDTQSRMGDGQQCLGLETGEMSLKLRREKLGTNTYILQENSSNERKTRCGLRLSAVPGQAEGIHKEYEVHRDTFDPLQVSSCGGQESKGLQEV